MYSYVGWAPGSREEAVASLQASYAALQHAVMTAAGWRADPYSPPAGPLWGWWSTVGIPVIDQWQKFYATQTGVASEPGIAEVIWRHRSRLRGTSTERCE